MVEDLLDDGDDVVEVVLLDDFEDEHGGDLVQGDFLDINEPHLVLCIRPSNSYLLHLPHTPIYILNIYLNNMLNRQLF